MAESNTSAALKAKIELLREKLNTLAESGTLYSKEICETSSELDKLISQYYSIKSSVLHK